MNGLEMKRLLAKISLGDNRQVDQLVIDDWFETIGHLTYKDAHGAVVTHRQQSTEYLTPAHITQIVRRLNPARAITMSPRLTDCGNHRWIGETCNFCETRRNDDD